MNVWLYYIVIVPFFVFSQVHTKEAIQLFNAQKYVQSHALLIADYKRNPKSEITLKYLGEIAGQRKDWSTAQDYFLRLKKQFPNKAEYHFKYGGALAMQVKNMNVFSAVYHISDIVDSFESAITHQPDYIEPRWALIEVYIQLPTLLGGSEKKAKRYTNELMELSPVDGYLSKGHIAEHYKRYQLAEKFFKKAVEISGGSKNSYKRLISLYIKMKDRQKEELVRKKYNQKYLG